MSDMLSPPSGGVGALGMGPAPVLTFEQLEEQKKARQEKAALIITKRDKFRRDRQAYEQAWFVNAAFESGNHYVRTNPLTGALQAVTPKNSEVPTIKINRLQAKARARRAKFRKNRPRVVIVPATLDYEDFQNARATQKVIDYLWRTLSLEKAYNIAQGWAEIASKGFWWYHWDPSAKRMVQAENPETGELETSLEQVGDVMVEASSPFEVLVADPKIAYLGDQPEIMRVKLRRIEEMKAKYPDYAEEFSGTAKDKELFRVEQRISSLSPTSASAGSRTDATEGNAFTLVTEYFKHPGADAPQGEYVVLVSDVLVDEGPLLYGFEDLPNPYPATEFPDLRAAGRFWNTTVIEQMVPLQQELNFLRLQLAIHARKHTHPRTRSARQQQVPAGAFGPESGDHLEYVAIPNVEPPGTMDVPQISNDLYRAIDLVIKDFDDVPQLFAQSEGKVGTATSGFQTNLLQEATDAVHSSDIREHELAIEEAAIKLRRLVKTGYTERRIISAIGANYEPDVFEFSSDMVDEQANLIVEVGSGLPQLKAAKQESVLALFREGMLGDPADPQVRQRAVGMLELGGVESAYDIARADEREQELETKQLEKDGTMPPVRFFQNHQVHYDVLALYLKSPKGQRLTDEKKKIAIIHLLFHMRQINVDSAIKAALDEGMPELLPVLQPPMPPAPPGMMPPPGPGGPLPVSPPPPGMPPGGMPPPDMAPPQMPMPPPGAPAM
jgi:hypothetical protein